MASTARRIVVNRSAPDELVDVFTRLDAAGKGWVNLGPQLDEGDDTPPETGMGRMFGGRGPTAPYVTWVAGKVGRRGIRKPADLGIEHGTGPKAVPRLRAAGIDVPPSWKVKADHAKRGLVFALPPDTDAAEVVDFLFRAATALSGVVIRDRWLVDVYER